jgi:hypothetical protein
VNLPRNHGLFQREDKVMTRYESLDIARQFLRLLPDDPHIWRMPTK